MDGSSGPFETLVSREHRNEPQSRFWLPLQPSPRAPAGVLATFFAQALRQHTLAVGRTVVPILAVAASTHLAMVTMAIRLRTRVWRPGFPETESEPDPVDRLLEDFTELGPGSRETVARNLTRLWTSFLDAFGGVSGFKAAPATEQRAFLRKIEAASLSMKRARGTEAEPYYVTVELLRQYLSFLQAGRSDEKAMALARCVVALIDRGHRSSGGVAIGDQPNQWPQGCDRVTEAAFLEGPNRVLAKDLR